MRNLLVFAFFSCLLHFQFNAMETPAEEKTWTWEIFHIIDQWTDPLSYFTDSRAPKVCDDVIRFGLDPAKKEERDKYRQYTGDAQCLDDIKSALKRQRALLTSLEAECLKDADSKVELLRDASERQPGYFSQNVLALIESYLKRAGKTARDTAHILGKQVGKTLDPVQLPEHLSSVDVIDETRAVTYQTIVNLVMGTPWYSKENVVNYMRKTWTDPLKYLIDEKAQNISLAMRHFHPRHKFHTDQWLFHNKLDLHKKLIHQALEREMRLTLAIQYAIEKEKVWMAVNLNPENSDNKFVMENIGSSYSPIARAAIKGFLNYKAQKQQENVDEKEKKEQIQKELAEKNEEVSKLLNSLGRKLSSAANKERLQSFTEEQRALYATLKNNLYGKQSVPAHEILDAHARLTELSSAVDQLLATSTPVPPSPGLNNSATSLPSFAPAAPAPKTPSNILLQQPSLPREDSEKYRSLLIERQGDIKQMLKVIDHRLQFFPGKLKLSSDEQALLDQGHSAVNRNIKLSEVLNIHNKLDALVNKINQLIPQVEVGFASIQTVVDTAHLAAATVTTAVQQTALPMPSLSPVPLFPAPEPSAAPKMAKQESATSVVASNSHSSSTSTNDASATSLKAESPQASPPKTPDGSLLETPPNPLASDEEFPDPRAQENAVQPPTNPAQTKLAAALTPAPAKQQAAPKNGGRKK